MDKIEDLCKAVETLITGYLLATLGTKRYEATYFACRLLRGLKYVMSKKQANKNEQL